MHSTSYREIERSYAVEADDSLPDLGALPGVAHVGQPDQRTLVATYVDTADLALVRAGVTLRRRTGGADEGWHLKVPAGDGRDEVHARLGATTRVPVALARMVTGWTRGRPLGPVAVIETRRTTWLLCGDDDVVLAEVADDAVVGTPADGGPATAWRELEVELVGADVDLLADADVLLAASGIVPRAEQRKVGTVLAHRLADVGGVSPATADGPAALVLHHRLTDLVAELLHRDCDVRRHVPDGVHQLRVTCRRLRGALATYRSLVDRTVTDPIRHELRWVARTLGDGRDAEVLHDRLRALVAEQPRTLVRGPVRRRLDRTYAARLRAADGHAQAVLTSRRYLRLLARLEALVTSPPFTEAAARQADDVLLDRVARDWRRLRRRVDLVQALDAAGERGDDEARDEALHDVRKAAKRLRYACEVLEPLWGEDAKALRKGAQEITQVLGERQDGAVARLDLRRIAADAAAAGENGFTYGLLHAREEAAGVAREIEFAEVWERVRHKRLRAWLG